MLRRAAGHRPRDHRRDHARRSAPGLTAITGETGAGKTLVVEALELLLGGRADAALVRDGATEARVEGRFVDRRRRRRTCSRGSCPPTAAVARLHRRAAGHRGRARRARERARRPPRPARAPEPARAGGAARRARRVRRRPRRSTRSPSCARPRAERRARSRAELDGLGGDERARARESRPAAVPGRRDRRRRRSTDPDEDDALRDEEALLADAAAIREALAARVPRGRGHGGRRARRARRPRSADRDAARRAARPAAGAPGRAGRARARPARRGRRRGRRSRAARRGPRPPPAAARARRKYGETLAEVLAYRDEVRRAARRARAPRRARGRSSRPSDAAADARGRRGGRRRSARPREAAPAPLGRGGDRRSCASWRCPAPRSSVEVEPGELTDDGADASPSSWPRTRANGPAAGQGRVGRRARACDAGAARRARSDAPTDARVRRGRRRDRRARPGPRSGGSSAVLGRTAPGAVRHPPRPGRGVRRPQVVVRKAEHGGRTVARAAPVDGRRPGARALPDAGGSRTRTTPAATPRSCSQRRAGADADRPSRSRLMALMRGAPSARTAPITVSSVRAGRPAHQGPRQAARSRARSRSSTTRTSTGSRPTGWSRRRCRRGGERGAVDHAGGTRTVGPIAVVEAGIPLHRRRRRRPARPRSPRATCSASSAARSGAATSCSRPGTVRDVDEIEAAMETARVDDRRRARAVRREHARVHPARKRGVTFEPLDAAAAAHRDPGSARARGRARPRLPQRPRARCGRTSASTGPVLIGVDGGADALLEIGFKPDIIIGDFDSVSEQALASGAGARPPRAPRRPRARARAARSSGACQYQEFVAEGTSEDVAMLLA